MLKVVADSWPKPTSIFIIKVRRCCIFRCRLASIKVRYACSGRRLLVQPTFLYHLISKTSCRSSRLHSQGRILQQQRTLLRRTPLLIHLRRMLEQFCKLTLQTSIQPDLRMAKRACKCHPHCTCQGALKSKIQCRCGSSALGDHLRTQHRCSFHQWITRLSRIRNSRLRSLKGSQQGHR